MAFEYPSVGRMFGIELEFFLIDSQGEVTNRADTIISSLKKSLADSEIKKECGQSMVELTSFPDISSREVFGKFFNDFETLLYEIEKNSMGLYPYATYPGKNANLMREDTRYMAKEKILGKKEFAHAGRCTGLHFHYSLPTKSYNPIIRFLYPDISPRNKEKVLSMFNFYVGIDPALITLMQSSPYYEGKYIAKDSRAAVYRGDPCLGFEGALYSRYPEFGRLNSYSGSYDEMIAAIRKRFEKWDSLLKENDIPFSDFTKKEASLLDSSWKPVKLTTHGTIESRGADINSPLKVIAFSVMMKSLSKYIQASNIKVQPSELGTQQPFTLEDDVLHIPERSSLDALQRQSVYRGLEDRSALDYSSRLISFAKGILKEELRQTLRPFEAMIEERSSVSDELVRYVKKKQGSTAAISQETARELALRYSEKMFKELTIAKKIMEKAALHGSLFSSIGENLFSV